MPAKLIDAGIDYLRVTSQDVLRQSTMFEYWRAIATRDERMGYEVQPGGVFGFWGKKTRHAIWGVKKDWALVQASGRFAKGGLRLALSKIQASRVDIQITMRVEPGAVGPTIRDCYNRACSAPNAGHRPREVRLIESRHQAQTVYIGARASDIYVRIYDKFAESKEEEYTDCVRYEVELKGRAAKQLWKRLAETGEGTGFLVKLLVDVLLQRGISVNISDFDHLPVMILRRERTMAEASLAWLERSVAPTVNKLAQERGWIAPFSALFSQALTDFDKGRIMSRLAFLWGS